MEYEREIKNEHSLVEKSVEIDGGKVGASLLESVSRIVTTLRQGRSNKQIDNQYEVTRPERSTTRGQTRKRWKIYNSPLGQLGRA